ncbi:MAG: hypothetical protein PX634_15820, partial [Microcystis sp. M53600_WE12]|nr:hypothetical protein [Microcystis sp. M53600_WE12]
LLQKSNIYHWVRSLRVRSQESEVRSQEIILFILPTPHTPHPTPYTLHPTPYTPHPTPCPLMPREFQ